MKSIYHLLVLVLAYFFLGAQSAPFTIYGEKGETVNRNGKRQDYPYTVTFEFKDKPFIIKRIEYENNNQHRLVIYSYRIGSEDDEEKKYNLIDDDGTEAVLTVDKSKAKITLFEDPEVFHFEKYIQWRIPKE